MNNLSIYIYEDYNLQRVKTFTINLVQTKKDFTKSERHIYVVIHRYMLAMKKLLD